MGGTHLEVATVEGTVGVDDHQGHLPTEHVTVIRLIAVHQSANVNAMAKRLVCPMFAPPAVGTVLALPQC